MGERTVVDCTSSRRRSSSALFSFSEHAHGFKVQSTHSTHESLFHGFFITLPLGMKMSNFCTRNLQFTVGL